MILLPDTSFLCALYRQQVNSCHADAYVSRLKGPLPVTTLLLFEFRQSTRLQIWLRGQNSQKGFSQREGTGMLADLQSDLNSRVLEVIPVDWADVHRLAETLSAKHTAAQGHRFADILHVATALHLSVRDFLTFDLNQQRLASAEGLRLPVQAG